MAASTINIECKRYGCMKNLLASFANCRYAARCDELRNELADKVTAAESDINHYLSERGRGPVLVQILKRGVKFDDRAARSPRKLVKPVSPAAINAKPRPGLAGSASPASVAKVKAITKRPRRAKRAISRPVMDQATAPRIRDAAAVPRPARLRVPDPARHRPGESRSRKRSKMPRRAKPLTKANVTASEGPAALTVNTPAGPARTENAARPSGERAAPRKKSAPKSRKPGGKVYIILEGQTASIVDEQGLMMHLFSNHSKNTRYFEANEVEARVQIVAKR